MPSAIANGLTLPNPLSNGTTNDAIPLMADLNYLLAVVNRAMIDNGSGVVNAQSAKISNLANGVSANDAVNLSQLGGYAALAGAAFTGAVSMAAALSAATITASGLITGNAGFAGTTLSLSGAINAAAATFGGNFLLSLNNTVLQLTDANGTHPYFVVDPSNNFSFSGTDASGAARNVFNVMMRSSSSTFNIPIGVVLGASLSVGSTLGVTGALTLPGALTTGTAPNSVGFLGILQNLHTSSYTIAGADNGQGVDFNGVGLTCTIGSGLPNGFTAQITNINASPLTIASAADTLTWAGTTSTGSRTLGQNGMAFIRRVNGGFLISGSGLS